MSSSYWNSRKHTSVRMCKGAGQSDQGTAKMLTRHALLVAVAHAMSVCAQGQGSAPGPSKFVIPPYQPLQYTDLWSSSDGSTHVADCAVQTLPLKSYVGGVGGLQADNYLGVLANSTSTIFVQMIVGQYTPSHNAPVSQFVTVISGSWYVPVCVWPFYRQMLHSAINFSLGACMCIQHKAIVSISPSRHFDRCLCAASTTSTSVLHCNTL